MNLLLEVFEPDQMVFDYGDKGDKFFIILKGKVSIQIPMKVPICAHELEKRKD